MKAVVGGFFVVFLVAQVFGLNKAPIQSAIDAFKKINNVDMLGKYIRYGCAQSSDFRSLVGSLQNVQTAGLTCIYNKAVSFKSKAQQKNVDAMSLLQNVQDGVMKECARYIPPFAAALPVLQKYILDPSSLLAVSSDNLPASAGNIVNLISALANDLNSNPQLANNKQQYSQRVKQITAAARSMSDADRAAIAKAYSAAGDFIVKGSKYFQDYQTYLNLIDKKVSGTLTAANKKNLGNLAKKFKDVFLTMAINGFKQSVNNIGSVQIPADIKSDGAVNSAIRVLAPFFQARAQKLTNGPNLATALKKMSDQADIFVAKYPNPADLIAQFKQGNIKMSDFAIPWNLLNL